MNSQTKEHQEIVKDLQEKLMSDILKEFALLTIFQRSELIRRLRDHFCLVCGDPQSVGHECEK